jgi:hypothetical protein
MFLRLILSQTQMLRTELSSCCDTGTGRPCFKDLEWGSLKSLIVRWRIMRELCKKSTQEHINI